MKKLSLLKLIVGICVLCWQTPKVWSDFLEHDLPFDQSGFTFTDYIVFKCMDSSAYDYAVVYYANNQSAYQTTACNKDLHCMESDCHGIPYPYLGFASYQDYQGTSGYLLQCNDWCGYVPHFSRHHNKTTGVWSDSGCENGQETLRLDPLIKLSRSVLTTFPLHIFNYHPANDDFLGDYGLGVVTFGSVIVDTNACGTPLAPYFKLPLPGGKQWVLSVEAGGKRQCQQTPDDPYHAGTSYYALDFVDFNVEDGDLTGTDVPILAAAMGAVNSSLTHWSSSFGWTVVLDHGNGYQTRYAHLKNEPTVSGFVTQGQQIGIMGDTPGLPYSDGVHLHFQIYHNGDSSASNPAVAGVSLDGYNIDHYKVKDSLDCHEAVFLSDQ